MRNHDMFFNIGNKDYPRLVNSNLIFMVFIECNSGRGYETWNVNFISNGNKTYIQYEEKSDALLLLDRFWDGREKKPPRGWIGGLLKFYHKITRRLKLIISQF